MPENTTNLTPQQVRILRILAGKRTVWGGLMRPQVTVGAIRRALGFKHPAGNAKIDAEVLEDLRDLRDRGLVESKQIESPRNTQRQVVMQTHWGLKQFKGQTPWDPMPISAETAKKHISWLLQFADNQLEHSCDPKLSTDECRVRQDRADKALNRIATLRSEHNLNA